MQDKIKMQVLAISEIVGNSDIGIILLADESHTLQLAIMCDKLMKDELQMRVAKQKVCNTMLPEILTQVLQTQTNYNFEIVINDVIDGVYKAMLVNTDTYQPVSLRASDAILLSLISKYPLYATMSLIKRQAVPLVKGSHGMAMPYNALPVQLLREAMDKAVETENYELASHVRDELKKRGEL